MQQVQAYMAKDGKLFESGTECEKYETSIEAYSQLANLIEKECYYDMNQADVKKFLVKNKQELAKILSNLQD